MEYRIVNNVDDYLNDLHLTAILSSLFTWLCLVKTSLASVVVKIIFNIVIDISNTNITNIVFNIISTPLLSLSHDHQLFISLLPARLQLTTDYHTLHYGASIVHYLT